MSLVLTLDYPTLQVVEPGYNARVTAAELAEQGDPTSREVWADPLTQTVMLKPRQLSTDWIDTVRQLDSVIRLDDLAINPADINAKFIYEAAFGSNAGPWIYHNSVFPLGYFTDGPAPGMNGIVVSNEIPEIGTGSITSHTVFQTLTALPPAASPPAPTSIGGYSDAKTLAETKLKMPANQALFFRWFNPEDLEGNRTYYIFYVGQYAIQVRDVVAEVYEDISPHGDRSLGRKVLTYPLWGNHGEQNINRASFMQSHAPWNMAAHTRYLLWLPFRRNQVLLLSNQGQAVLLATRPDTAIRRNAGNTDWENVRSDTLRVKVVTSQYGRFQIQRVKYSDTGEVDGPIKTLDYQPATPPLLVGYYDADNGSSLSLVQSSPPAYPMRERPNDDCPTPGTPPTWLASQHGVQVTLNTDASNRWTPFFYAYDLHKPSVYGPRPTTPLDVPDVGAVSRLIDLNFSLGLKPGEGKGQAEIMDFDPFPLGPFYYRSEVPIQVADGATTFFQGVTDELEVTPLKEPAALPRRFTIPLVDNWRLLERLIFKELEDFGGKGHITAVLEIATRAGIGTALAETPPINTPALNRRWNQTLGGEPTPNQLSEAISPPWRVKQSDTAAKFIARIAENFSGWDVGFRADGKLFYLPKDYYTTVGTRFYATRAAAVSAGNPAAPLYRGPVTFTPKRPEANVIMVVSGAEKDGGRTYSPVFVDWASVLNPAAPNYLGAWCAEVVELAGGYTCPELTWVARTIFQQTRRRHRMVQFEADYVSAIHVGHVVELNPYGEYRVTEIQARFQKRNWHPATYSATFLERGY